MTLFYNKCETKKAALKNQDRFSYAMRINLLEEPTEAEEHLPS